MSIPYESTGRTQQKSRTRDALVAAVHGLLRQGRTPTVEEAARAAGISRTTAYRYYPTRRDLLVAAYPEIEAPSLLADPSPAGPEARLDAVLASIERQILGHELELRTALRLSLEPGIDRSRLLVRQGRAIRWVDDALRPLQGTLPQHELRRLVLAIRSAFGIEAFVWLTDVGALSRDEAFSVMRWSAKTLLRSVLRPASRTPTRSKRSRPAQARGSGRSRDPRISTR